MQNARFLLLLLLPCFLPSLVKGQSLLEDTRALVSALKILEQGAEARMDTVIEYTILRDTLSTERIRLDTIGADTLIRESASAERVAMESSACALAILYNYDNPTGPVPASPSQLKNISERYAGNHLIRELARQDGLGLFPEEPDSLFVSKFQEKLYALRAAPRHKMMGLLYAEEARSPSSYLSTAHTLRRYSVPPVANTAALRMAAEGSNQNISKGIISAPDIIQGLFDFIIKRAQQEVAINFMERLLGEEVKDIHEVFPAVAGTFDGHNFTYSNSFFERLRQAFFEDLQLLSVRLPNLLLESDYFKALQDDPISYNLLAVYSMAGMAQNGYPLEEILPITNRYLYDSYGEAKKSVNLHLAEKAFTSPEYKALITTTEDIIGEMNAIYIRLNKEETALRNELDSFQLAHPGTLRTFNLDASLKNPEFDFEVLLYGANDSLGFGLNWLPDLLRGELDSTAVLDYNSIQNYDKFFGRERSPEQWRAAGLELARNLNGPWYKDSAVDAILRNWRRALTDYRLSAQRWMNSVDTLSVLTAALQEAEHARENLQATVENTLAYWDTIVTRDQSLALQLLYNIARDFSDIQPDPLFGVSDRNALDAQTERLQEIERRLIQLNDRLSESRPALKAGSPVNSYLASKQPAIPYTDITPMIDTLSLSLQRMQEQLSLLDAKQATGQIKARDNAEPLLQLTEILTQLVYSMRSNNDTDRWINRDDLNSMLNGGVEQRVFLGLMQQRLLDIKSIGRFSTNGLAQLLELTVRDLPLLINTDTITPKDSLSFYRKASFAINAFNRTMELPLFSQTGGPGGQFLPITEQKPGLKQLPELSDKALELIYFLNIKDHRHAVSSAIRIFSSLDAAIDSKKEGKRRLLVGFFQNYGDFIADLVDAKTGDEIKGLMSSIANPPGSSRTKRRQDLSVSLNAYLGGAFGYESWEDNKTGDTDTFWSLAPTMPVGISISKLLGKKKESEEEKRPSFSAFISFVDLGGLLSYRGGSEIDAESKITFKNIFKPGLQFHWNPRKTPFYVGLGGHYGSQFLEADGTELSVRSLRGFVAFGVDVPIKTLYQK
ncbi:MAG: hypothetical protein H6573_06070 [Lewinellaceae bacterium]|nr:hypothetical protein [Phaeodactylibacter sp.]MCB0612360.1 hypothetical protein [Phaeodactylibacter sp.]MCB9347070.1 hypothetical protein [Lewinellaceae bacterium]